MTPWRIVLVSSWISTERCWTRQEASTVGGCHIPRLEVADARLADVVVH